VVQRRSRPICEYQPLGEKDAAIVEEVSLCRPLFRHVQFTFDLVAVHPRGSTVVGRRDLFLSWAEQEREVEAGRSEAG